MSVRRRRGHGGHGGGHDGPDERWMASYMDMVTVLMCLFIVLYAISTVDQDKFVKLKASLATGFGQESSETVDTASGVVVPPDAVDAKGEGFVDSSTPPSESEIENVPTAAELAEVEVDNLEQLEEQLRIRLEQAGHAHRVDFAIDERGLTVKLVGSETFFDGNSDALRPIAREVLDTIGPVLAGVPNRVSVEGHADPRGTSGRFPTDWELSSARATQVLRRMVESSGVPGQRISAVGFGSSRPLAPGDGPAERELNRRVDIVVHSMQPDAVRALIPGVLAGEEAVVAAVPPERGG